MKALSVRQPWASLIASGQKTIELRSCRTRYRGPILLCASKHRQGSGPKGLALAVVDIVECRPARDHDAPAACCLPESDEWAWILSNVRCIKPFPVRGMLGLFSVQVEPESLKMESPEATSRNPQATLF